ncbi:MAG: head GIN domain-containing protein [Flavobacteriales bacterium]|nr:head GIN domain-containing protein [Flavobacteriales bacterium]
MKRLKQNFTDALFICVCIGWLSSCNKPNSPDCFQHAGDYTTEKRLLDEFSSIEIRDYIQIELCDSTESFTEITAPENLIPDIITEVENGKLFIRNENSCNWVRSFQNKITVRICAPDFHDIQHYGTGNVSSVNTIQSNYFRMENRQAAGVAQLDMEVDSCAILIHTGVSDFALTGHCHKAELYNQGWGILDARNLVTHTALVNNSTINDIYVHATDYLFGFIAFSGNIYYKGNPGIDSEIEGDGQLIPVE